jgi:hypothetical protein
MKKIILTIAVIFLSISSFAQIKVIEKTSVEIGYLRLGLSMDKNIVVTLDNNYYTFMYKDIQYTQITDYKYFSFKGKENLDGLYNIMMEQFKAEKNTELNIELDGNTIIIVTKKMMGTPYLLVMVMAPRQPIGSFYVEPKYMDTLFGK